MDEDLICFCCRNNNCEHYTFYNGYLMCEYCLDDWFKERREFQYHRGHTFDEWCIKHKEKLDKERKTGGKRK